MSSYTAGTNWRAGPSNIQPGFSNIDNGPRAKCDQVIFEAISKASEIVVGSRAVERSAPSFGSYVNTSSRFNLTLSENPEVRSILQKWRSALHVPLRLDVFFQHESDGTEEAPKRELLERWCLEYNPVSQDLFTSRECRTSTDPIVQLRHVCKRIIIWLRTLYCASRLLPSQAFQSRSNGNYHPQIGFSIYAHTHGGDDVKELTENQGFLLKSQPSSVLTPYGELGWQVIYAPPSMIEKLLPLNQKTAKPMFIKNAPSPSRPIPMSRNENTFVDHQQQIPTVPQSAPTGVNFLIPPAHYQQPHHHQPPMNSYQPGFRPAYQRSVSAQGPELEMEHRTLERRNTFAGPKVQIEEPPRMPDADKAPERVMSGLSLALMMSNEKASAEAPDASKTRRTALHNAPPHLMNNNEQLSTSPATGTMHFRTTSEYGYGYNNHIAWQQIRPSTNIPTTATPTTESTQSTSARSSPSLHPKYGSAGSRGMSPLSTTPPSGALFLGATPPTTTGPLIPPRHNAVTPPFPSRPIGFSDEPPKQMLPPAVEQPSISTASIPPVTSLDLLHSSPFQMQVAGSALSSLSGHASAFGTSLMTTQTDRTAMWTATLSGGPAFPNAQDVAEETYDDMPFAVDSMDPPSSSSTAASNRETSSNAMLGNSAAIASFAQKCAPSQHRLKMFESAASQTNLENQQQQQQSLEETLSSLADQLAEFRSFGASLDLTNDGTNNGTNVASNPGSTSTPISLQT